MTEELERTLIHDGKIYFGEQELTNLCWTLVHIYRFNNKNQDPEAIVFPDIKPLTTKVGEIKIEYPKEADDGEKNFTL